MARAFPVNARSYSEYSGHVKVVVQQALDLLEPYPWQHCALVGCTHDSRVVPVGEVASMLQWRGENYFEPPEKEIVPGPGFFDLEEQVDHVVVASSNLVPCFRNYTMIYLVPDSKCYQQRLLNQMESLSAFAVDKQVVQQAGEVYANSLGPKPQLTAV